MTLWGAIAAIAAFGSTIAGGTASAETADAALAARTLSSTVGIASYYGADFNGRRTADGEVFDMHGLSAAHKSLPIPCYARVTNLGNGRSVVVRVNDRGPYIAGRMLDVSERTARLLAFGGGMARVRLDYLGKAGPGGPADQRSLLASLKDPRELALAHAKPADDGVTTIERSVPALGYAEPQPHAPATAALEAALRPTLPPPPSEPPLSIAARLDASARQIEATLETARQTAEAAAASSVAGVVAKASPYGALVVDPFKRLVEAAR